MDDVSQSSEKNDTQVLTKKRYVHSKNTKILAKTIKIKLGNTLSKLPNIGKGDRERVLTDNQREIIFDF